MGALRSIGLALGLLLSFSAVAADDILPPCMVGTKELLVNNAQVSDWKRTTANQYLGRAHVVGRISRIYPERNGHEHFQIEFEGPRPDVIEMVYSLDFGPLPRLAIGMAVEACGDYITSNQATVQYPPSPDGAIIHWLHFSPNPKKHASGYMAIDGKIFGSRPGRPPVPQYSQRRRR